MPFYNISNHPSADWTEAQKGAALLLAGDDEIIDIPFPAVPPEMGEEELLHLAQDCARRWRAGMVKTPSGDWPAAMLAGEAGLTALLTMELHREGVRSFAATTRRESSEEVGADGTVRKTAMFRFVRFRRYVVWGQWADYCY